MTHAMHTPLPWALEHTPGRVPPKDEYVPDDCERFNLARATIVAPTVRGGGHKFNETTRKWDIPIPREITEIIFDDRSGKGNRPAEHLANAKFIVAACNSHYDMLAALRALVDYSRVHREDGQPIRREHLEAARAAIAKAEGK